MHIKDNYSSKKFNYKRYVVATISINSINMVFILLAKIVALYIQLFIVLV